jgi:hypothetical protein
VPLGIQFYQFVSVPRLVSAQELDFLLFKSFEI